MTVTLKLGPSFLEEVGGLLAISLLLLLPSKEVLSVLIVYLLLLEIQLFIGANATVFVDLLID